MESSTGSQRIKVESTAMSTGGRSLRLLQWTLLTIGIVLIGIWAGARLHGWHGKKTDIRRFEEARERAASTPTSSPTVRPELPLDLPVDTSLWAADRIDEYEQSLTHEFAPPLAVMRVPKIDLEVAVLAGTTELVLNRGVGHITGTPLPGQPGNVGIAGHRDGYFRGLKDVAEGDLIELETLDGSAIYTITELFIVDPPDVWVLEPTDTPSLTLVTCYPFYYVGSAPQRFIVRAERTPAS